MPGRRTPQRAHTPARPTSYLNCERCTRCRSTVCARMQRGRWWAP